MEIMDIPFDINFPDSILLHTKNLTCLYEEGRLRYVKAGDTEIVRMIYGAVRDANWGTVICDIKAEHIHQGENSFTITYTAHYRQDDIIYRATYRIEGKPDDTITFDMEGKALSGFKGNRIGLCVHLPVKECSGIPVTVIHPDRISTGARFPENISPRQPFGEIEQLYWTTADNTDIRLGFAGEVFESEDQRNWMDHSFKIYGRPLALPFPFEVNTGSALKQTICLRIDIKEGMSGEAEMPVSETGNVPAIGIAAAEEPELLTVPEIAVLKALPLMHYRAELDFTKDWQTVFNIHCINAKAIGVALELVLFFTDHYIEETRDFLLVITYVKDNIRSILPQHKSCKVTPPFLQEYFYLLIKKSFPQILIGYRTDIYFAELNRQRPQYDLYDFVSFSMNPQVHSFDERTMLENVETIPDIIRTIRSFTDKPVFVFPVTFKKRKNHDGTEEARHDPVNDFDARQNTALGAAWFLLCLFGLRDAQQVTFFKATGSSGIIQTANENAPLYQALTRLKSFPGATMTKIVTSSAAQIMFRNSAGEKLSFYIR